MKKTALIAALALAAPLALAVSPAHAGPPSPEQRAERMSMRLGLTPEQTRSVTDILSAQQEKRQAWRESHRQETRDLLGGVLSARQLEQLDAQRERMQAMRAERRDGRPCRGERRGGGARW